MPAGLTTVAWLATGLSDRALSQALFEQRTGPDDVDHIKVGARHARREADNVDSRPGGRTLQPVA